MPRNIVQHVANKGKEEKRRERQPQCVYRLGTCNLIKYLDYQHSFFLLFSRLSAVTIQDYGSHLQGKEIPAENTTVLVTLMCFG